MQATAECNKKITRRKKIKREERSTKKGETSENRYNKLLLTVQITESNYRQAQWTMP